LISHDHRDHLDKKSLKFLFNREDKPTILTGLEMDKWLNSNFKNDKYSCQTAGWYQQYQTNLKDINIFFLPARHWSKRDLFDTNKRLWGSFVIQSSEKTIYFSGDTGYGSHLKEVRSLFGNIDIAIIGIGAYQPEWFMEPNHISPKNALKAIDEMGANQFIPMHYGTFDVSDEPLFEPIESLKKIHMKEYTHVNLNILKIGEVYEINKTNTLK
jgi:L-ascorbate metabolism protein UlaG (beta-lactamase superfamily)